MNCQAQIRIGADDTITIWKWGKTTYLQLIKKNWESKSSWSITFSSKCRVFLVFKFGHLLRCDIRWIYCWYIRSDMREYAQDFLGVGKIFDYFSNRVVFFLPTISWKFQFSQKLSIQFERNSPQFFYILLESYRCNGIEIVWLGCEKHSQSWPKNGQKTAVFRLFLIFAKTVHTIRTKFRTVLLRYILVLCV